MRSSAVMFFSIFILAGMAFAKDFKASEIIVEAESSFMRGDLLNANRFYDLAYEKSSQSLTAKNIENIVITKHLLMPLKEFLTYCKQETKSGKFKVETQFYCAKSLIYSENYVEAIDYLKNIPKEYQRLEYHFLNATLFLKLKKTNQCLEEMKIAEKKITDNTSFHFRDLINVIHARCLLVERRYEDALVKFQSLSVNSDFYLTTLEEQAWAQFKKRNLTSARDILKILISYFTGQDINNQIFGASVYFRAKYLQAYIELISENRKRSKELFGELKSEVQKFKKENFHPTAISQENIRALSKLRSYSQLLDKEYAFIYKFRNFMDPWSTIEEQKDLDKELRYLIALNSEINTIRRLKNKKFRSYLRTVIKTQRLQKKLIVKSMKTQLIRAKRTIDSLEFKANMGQIENFWADRTEGKKTLGEVLDAYKREVTYVEDHLGK